jgi:hypothetical protein
MATSPASTVPDAPLVFATLTPSNALAIRAFSSVVDAILTEDPDFDRCSNFVSFDQSQVSLSSLLPPPANEDAPSFSENSDFEPDPSATATPQHDDMVFNGHYQFCIDSSTSWPRLPKLGWRAGVGRWKQSRERGDIEILLAYDPAKTFTRGIHGAHAIFNFEKQGNFAVRPLHEIRVNGDSVDKNRGAYSLGLKTRSLIEIGMLKYDFAHQIPPNNPLHAQFQASLGTYLTSELTLEPPYPTISATPSENMIAVGNWTMQGAVGLGASGLVSAASRNVPTFQVVAVKCFARNSGNQKMIADEVDAARAISLAVRDDEDNRFLLRFIEVIYERGNATYNSTFPENVYIFYTPLCRGSLYSLFLGKKITQPDETTCTLVFHQILKGIRCLHDAGFVHRDIKPQNIGIASLKPPHAVILDFGNASQGKHFDPTPGRIGTCAYLAPEMERIQYTNSVDIWAAGIIGYELFVGKNPFNHGKINLWRYSEHKEQRHRLYEKYFAPLSLQDAPPMNALISQMLSLDPTDRITADEALQHPVFNAVSTNNDDNAEAGLKRKR